MIVTEAYSRRNRILSSIFLLFGFFYLHYHLCSIQIYFNRFSFIFEGPIPRNLQKARAPVIPNNICERPGGNLALVFPSMFCTMYDTGYQSSCTVSHTVLHTTYFQSFFNVVFNSLHLFVLKQTNSP